MSAPEREGAVSPSRVVWWRDPAGDRDLPRTHGVGWAVVDGSQIRALQIVSSHLRLQPADIEYELRTCLADHHLDGYELGPVIEGDAEIGLLVRLAVAGHRIARVDLVTTLGLEAVGGVVAELTGRGVRGTVLIEATLGRHLEHAVADWAGTALSYFAAAAEPDLVDGGWRKVSPGRWQLVARQIGTTTR